MTAPTDTATDVLQEMTIEDVRAIDPDVVLFGIGSTEPHGPHLPYGTDLYQTDGVCRRAVTRANERGASALMYPTLPIGNNVNFKAYPFACRIGVRTLMNVVLDVIEAIECEGVRKVVLVNGHGGNTATVQATLREHAGRHDPDEGAFVCMTSTVDAVPESAQARIEYPSLHAGESEASRKLYLRPDLVREAEFDDFPVQEPTIDELRSDAVSYVPPWHGFMPESAGGETRESSAETGKAVVEGAANFVADVLVALDEAPVHELFPFPRDE